MLDLIEALAAPRWRPVTEALAFFALTGAIVSAVYGVPIWTLVLP